MQMRVLSTQDDVESRELDGADTPVVSAVERGLFKAALDFYGAAEAVIDYRGPDRPHLRWDLDGLQRVRAAMGALERRIGIACRAGLSAEQIVRITRLDPDVVQPIVERQRAGFA
jgi:hypothetical protein